MPTCKECFHFGICEPYTEPDESYPEVDGCYGFKSKEDVVHVVRCKDCKQWRRNVGHVDSPNGHCFCHYIETNGYDYCSYGERKDNEA